MTAGRLVRAQVRPGVVLLADCSTSMLERDDPRNSKRRIDGLADLLVYILQRTRLQGLVCFHERPIEVPLEGHIKLPKCEASTALHLALAHVRTIVPRPTRIVLITDGEPNSEEQALAAARILQPMPIDAYYVGPEGNHVALAFMECLAKISGGRWGEFDLTEPHLLGEEIRLQITHRR